VSVHRFPADKTDVPVRSGAHHHLVYRDELIEDEGTDFGALVCCEKHTPLISKESWHDNPANYGLAQAFSET
jgi:hypothetical protein